MQCLAMTTFLNSNRMLDVWHVIMDNYKEMHFILQSSAGLSWKLNGDFKKLQKIESLPIVYIILN